MALPQRAEYGHRLFATIVSQIKVLNAQTMRLNTFVDKTFYLFTTNRRVYSPETHQQSRAYFVTTKDIFANNWSEPTYLDVSGYDADLFLDNSGIAYVTRADVNNPIEKVRLNQLSAVYID